MLKVTSVVLNLIFLISFSWYFLIHIGINAYYQEYISKKEIFLNDIYYKAKVDAFFQLNKLLDPKLGYSVFVGDSIVEQFPIEEFFAEKRILNRGIGQDTTIGVLRRLESNINNINIGNFILMIGHNDIKYRSIDETVKNIELILTNVIARKKYFISLLPAANEQDHRKIKMINQRVKAFSGRIGFKYFDVYSLFIDINGKINPVYFYDGVHPNVKGHLIIKDKISIIF